jgi:hypothetical protein
MYHAKKNAGSTVYQGSMYHAEKNAGSTIDLHYGPILTYAKHNWRYFLALRLF